MRPEFVNGPELRWAAWHGDEFVSVPVGARWSVEAVSLGEADALGVEEASRVVGDAARASFPDVTPETTIAIAIDDMARPTPLESVVPPLVETLLTLGASEERIRIVAATGSHRPLTRIDFEKKIGPVITSKITTYSNNPYENLTSFGTSSRGTPIRINSHFAGADRRVVCGCVMPHPYMGFGGGAKMVLPGLSGIESLEANHRSVLRGLTGGHLTLEGNEARQDVEEIAGRVGVDLAIQVVVGTRREIVALFAGDVIASHRAAAARALEIYRARPVPTGEFDVIYLGAYPKDGEQYQLGNAFNAIRSAGRELLRPGGSLVIVARCAEGLGWHGLQGEGMRLHRKPVRREMMENGREMVIFSPGLTRGGLGASYHDGALLAQTQAELAEILHERHGGEARALVVPCAPLAVLEEAD